ncbi:response regulator [Streptomyces sp. CA-135486]|uniref:response regulator n=1 Tax=Streptomyces sp. CA-135486 TaxID=3240049 RepID=UPI003D8EB157
MTVADAFPDSDPDQASVIRTLIVDDVDDVRDGLARLLARIPTIEVVGTAGDGAQAVRLVDELRPAVVLMDMRMPVMDGLEATGRIAAKHDDTAVVVLSAYGDDSMVLEALLRGARGYLLKGADANELTRAIEAAARGESRVSGSLTKPLLDRLVETLATECQLRAEAEALVADLAERHAESEGLSTRLAGLLDAAPVGIVETDTSGRILRWNRAAERIYGWHAEEVLGRPDPNPAPPDTYPAPPGAVTVTDQAADPESSRHVRRDGSTVHVEIVRAALTEPDGSTTGAIKVITDVTRRKELEAEQVHRRSAWVRRMRRRQRGLPRR